MRLWVVISMQSTFAIASGMIVAYTNAPTMGWDAGDHLFDTVSFLRSDLQADSDLQACHCKGSGNIDNKVCSNESYFIYNKNDIDSCRSCYYYVQLLNNSMQI
jgi:hypothetical protein